MSTFAKTDKVFLFANIDYENLSKMKDDKPPLSSFFFFKCQSDSCLCKKRPLGIHTLLGEKPDVFPRL